MKGSDRLPSGPAIDTVSRVVPGVSEDGDLFLGLRSRPDRLQIPDSYSLVLVDNEILGRDKVACVVNMYTGTLTFFNNEYRTLSVDTSEASFASVGGTEVRRFDVALHMLLQRKGPRGAIHTIPGLSCRFVESPLGSGNFALFVRLLYYDELKHISQFTALARLGRWPDGGTRQTVIGAWEVDVGMARGSITGMFGCPVVRGDVAEIDVDSVVESTWSEFMPSSCRR